MSQVTVESPTEASGADADEQLREAYETQREWLRRAAHVCEQAARGNLEARLLNVDVDADTDLARILYGINSLLDYTDAFVREVKAVLGCAAQDKFYRRVALRGMVGTFGQAAELINNASEEMKGKSDSLVRAKAQRLEMADSFEETVKSVTDSVANTAEQLQLTSNTLSHAARETSERSSTALDVSAKSVENVRHVAQSTEELQESLSQIDLKVQESNETVRRAVTEVQQATEIMSELDKSSSSIDTVVDTIRGITKQTQLLSLNAAIEAARAGAAGAGFAIVANEVQKLAEQTREATEHVRGDINRVQSSTTKAVRSIKQFGDTVDVLSGASNAIAELVSDQRTATATIRTNVSEASDRSESVNNNVRQASEAAGETAEAASQLHGSANELSTQSKTLSDGVEQMLVEIRS